MSECPLCSFSTSSAFWCPLIHISVYTMCLKWLKSWSVNWSSCQSVSCSKYVHILFRLTAVMWSHLKNWVMSRLRSRNLLFTILSIYWRSVKPEANLWMHALSFSSQQTHSNITDKSCGRINCIRPKCFTGKYNVHHLARSPSSCANCFIKLLQDETLISQSCLARGWKLTFILSSTVLQRIKHFDMTAINVV